MRNILFLAALILLTSAAVHPAKASASFAFCAPPNGGVSCMTYKCEILGKTTLDGDNKNIIACLSSSSTTPDCSAGDCVWKTLTRQAHTSKKVDLTIATVKYYDTTCSEPVSAYPNCANACRRYCNNGCKTAATNCTGIKDNGNTYSTGYVTEWNSSTGMTQCACFY